MLWNFFSDYRPLHMEALVPNIMHVIECSKKNQFNNSTCFKKIQSDNIFAHPD